MRSEVFVKHQSGMLYYCIGIRQSAYFLIIYQMFARLTFSTASFQNVTMDYSCKTFVSVGAGFSSQALPSQQLYATTHKLTSLEEILASAVTCVHRWRSVRGQESTYCDWWARLYWFFYCTAVVFWRYKTSTAWHLIHSRYSTSE